MEAEKSLHNNTLMYIHNSTHLNCTLESNNSTVSKCTTSYTTPYKLKKLFYIIINVCLCFVLLSHPFNETTKTPNLHGPPTTAADKIGTPTQLFYFSSIDPAHLPTPCSIASELSNPHDPRLSAETMLDGPVLDGLSPFCSDNFGFSNYQNTNVLKRPADIKITSLDSPSTLYPPASQIMLDAPAPLPMLDVSAPRMLNVLALPMLDVPALPMLDVPASIASKGVPLRTPGFIAFRPSNPHDPGPLAAWAKYPIAMLTYHAFSAIAKYAFIDFLCIPPRSPSIDIN